MGRPKADIPALTSIALCASTAEVIAKDASKTQNIKAETIIRRSHALNPMFNHSLITDKDAIRICNNIFKFNATSFGSSDKYVHTGFCVQILNDLMKDRARTLTDEQYQALKKLERSMVSMHKYFDRECSKPTDGYEEASKGAKYWWAIVDTGLKSRLYSATRN